VRLPVVAYVNCQQTLVSLLTHLVNEWFKLILYLICEALTGENFLISIFAEG